MRVFKRLRNIDISTWSILLLVAAGSILIMRALA